jgi:hypothetical protein
MRDPTVAPCSDWEEKLATIHLDDLSLAQREALDRHVAICEVCTTAIEDYLEMDDLIRSSITVNHPLELRTDLLPEQSVQDYNPGPLLDLALDPEAYYIIRIFALCWTRYTEMLLNEQVGDEVIVTISIGQALRVLFDKVIKEEVSLCLHSPELSTKRPYYSIQIDAQCQQLLEPLTLKAMELTLEGTISALLQELFGVAIVDKITIDRRSKYTREEVGEQTDIVCSGHLVSN